MASVISHPAVPLALAVAIGPERVPPALTIVACAASALPDIDAIGCGRRPYGHCSGIAASRTRSSSRWRRRSCVCSLFAGRGTKPWTTFLLVFASTASHGLLDALTTGGMGVCLLQPLFEISVIPPWRHLVSPIGVGRFFSGGLPGARSELLWIWLPSAVLANTRPYVSEGDEKRLTNSPEPQGSHAASRRRANPSASDDEHSGVLRLFPQCGGRGVRGAGFSCSSSPPGCVSAWRSRSSVCRGHLSRPTVMAAASESGLKPRGARGMHASHQHGVGCCGKVDLKVFVTGATGYIGSHAAGLSPRQPRRLRARAQQSKGGERRGVRDRAGHRHARGTRRATGRRPSSAAFLVHAAVDYEGTPSLWTGRDGQKRSHRLPEGRVRSRRALLCTSGSWVYGDTGDRLVERDGADDARRARRVATGDQAARARSPARCGAWSCSPAASMEDQAA